MKKLILKQIVNVGLLLHPVCFIVLTYFNTLSYTLRNLNTEISTYANIITTRTTTFLWSKCIYRLKLKAKKKITFTLKAASGCRQVTPATATY